MHTLSNRGYLITRSTMQGLCLENNKGKEAVNGYFANTTDSNIIQTPVTFEPAEKAFNGSSSIINSFPFGSHCARIVAADYP